ncbi:hypothetical protein TPHA_0E00440 [Tetrapisispora phaffii CBS 4417]|uniref:Uncharacterized protein n=1 Tax=Tetrapisispora phaffii (strain ATCC 24235 / CBS 4417 / NBRC 1672 / NRRL Y-8282 / UCD 70-5) TaxID=1071381 RepID=G8BTB2_TETPH|nr:hypothetical protein TPHA_0E00440 [Tetrapisispora phaffii CBS 4417]CCE63140.1 hypothetical protein TPHA_0E00440 [Tetrapisispora phaffii CBS 4417]
MGFFSNNPLIEFCHKIMKRPSTLLMWCFTGIIISSSIYLLLPSFHYDGKRDRDKCK